MIKIEVYDSIYSEFKSWVDGVFEDDPIDPEIKFIYFVLSFASGINSLLFGGCEFQNDSAVNFDYCPLESQFFYCPRFLELSQNDALHCASNMIDEVANERKFEQIFKYKTICFVSPEHKCVKKHQIR